ncbi:hypothetical protein [Sphingobium sp. YR657]|uniref:hypothetical protein n=1 Tax=Sphingobium sp. YR657 TaxID=1884366 RepID=UPI0009340A5F|nr:hypothetical protein [Sphingobium sp. YR657]
MSISIYRCLATLCKATALFVIQPAYAQQTSDAPRAIAADPVVGEYSHAEMELAAGLRIKPDGTFEYGLSVGSLDERAQGRWRRVGERIELTSEPRPVPPTITASRVENGQGREFAIRLVAPNGSDIPGIDLRIDFASGPPLESYLAGGPWTLPKSERRQPRFVTFSKKAYRIDSGQLQLSADSGTIAVFLLTPNDFGVVDMTGAYLEQDGDSLELTRPEGAIIFERVNSAPDPAAADEAESESQRAKAGTQIDLK